MATSCKPAFSYIKDIKIFCKISVHSKIKNGSSKTVKRVVGGTEQPKTVTTTLLLETKL